MSKIRHAVVMAAGRGLRMMPLTQDLPKPMVPFLGSTLIARNLEKLLPLIENIHVTVGYRGSILAKHVLEIGVRSVFNTDGRSNSWWITDTLLSKLDEPVFVLTCDNVVEMDFDSLAADYYAIGRPPCMVVPVEPVPGLGGDYIFQEGSRVIELSRTRLSDIYCSGIQVLNPARVGAMLGDARQDHDFYSVWSSLIRQRGLYVSSVRPTHWYAVDTMEQLERLRIIEEAKR